MKKSNFVPAKSCNLKKDDNFVDILPNKSYNEYNNNYIIIANLNPFRYRGYYYDTETGLYYLTTRYYDPEIARFLNADDVANTETKINGINLYSYCHNNPVMSSDALGNIPFSNSVFRSYLKTTLFRILNGDASRVFGNLEYNVIQNLYSSSDNGFLYSYTSVGNDTTSSGVGINLWNIFGIEGYYDSNYNIGVNLHITPYFDFGISLGADGIGLSMGLNIENTTYEISANIGLGTLAIVAAVGLVVAIFPSSLLSTAVVGMGLLFTWIGSWFKK